MVNLLLFVQIFLSISIRRNLFSKNKLANQIFNKLPQIQNSKNSIMGDIIQCSLVKADIRSQLSNHEQPDTDVNMENQLWQQQLVKKIEKFQMLNKMDTNSLGFEKLAEARKDIIKFDTMLENDSAGRHMDHIFQQKQNTSSKYINQQAHTKVRDYICFKKHSPKLYYKFFKMIHSSKTSKIYEVIHNNNNSRKTIKVIKPKQSICVNKFVNFMSVLSKLDHPNIIRFYEVYEYKNNQYLVMEFMEGGSLRDIPSYRRVSKSGQIGCVTDCYFEQIKIITKQILYALRYLHDNNIAHLNIHTKNILLSNKFGSKKQVFAKLIGFGSSLTNLGNGIRPMDHELYVNKCQVNQIHPPEVLYHKSVSVKTDIWMMGIALFEAITKVKINKGFLRQGDNDRKKLPRYLQAIWKKLEGQLNFCQSHCIDLICKMVAQSPKQRPSALECLQHPWFVSLDLDQLNSNIKQSSHRAFRNTLIQKKSNNLINYIQNVIIYKNITQPEMIAVSEIFTNLDKDKNGSVQIEQLIDYFQSESNSTQNPKMFQYCLQLVNSLDKDGSGTIDYHQFTKGLVNKRNHITRQAIEQIFNHIDTDGDGKIVLSELKNILKNCNLDQLEYYLKKIDKNYDQTINKAQFINYCIFKFQQKWDQDGRKSYK